MMYPTLLISGVLINFVIANDWNHTRHDEEHKVAGADKSNNVRFALWNQHLWKPHKRRATNKTYFDGAENMIRLPTMANFDKKKKILKKSPKRTIQKIIKKNRQKTKKIYVVLMTTSMTPEVNEFNDDMSAKKEVVTTEKPSMKKRTKKYSTKLPRYPKPFQKLQKKKFHKRTKRGIFDNDDILYVIKDFDENKFLEGEY